MLADRNSKGGRQNKFCLSVTMQQKQTIMHYQPLKAAAFLRITVAVPNLVTQARGAPLLPPCSPCMHAAVQAADAELCCGHAGILENGLNLDSLQRHMAFTTYDSHVLFALRFMIDCDIVGGNWVELKVATLRFLLGDSSKPRAPHSNQGCVPVAGGRVPAAGRPGPAAAEPLPAGGACALHQPHQPPRGWYASQRMQQCAQPLL
jgi:hypothetical protein